jgi:hypothetical protein
MLDLFNLYLQQLGHEFRNALSIIDGLVNDRIQGFTIEDDEFVSAKIKLDRIKYILDIVKTTAAITNNEPPDFDQLRRIILDCLNSETLPVHKLKIQNKSTARRLILVITPIPKDIFCKYDLNHINFLLLQKILAERAIKFEFKQVKQELVIKVYHMKPKKNYNLDINNRN